MADSDPVAVSVAAVLAVVLDGLSSRASRRAYEADWKRYTDWLVAHDLGPLDARPRHVAAHIAALRGAGLKKTTTARALSVLREVYGALVRDELILLNPARDVKNPKADHTPKAPWLDEEEVRQLLDAPPIDTWRGRRDRLCLRLLLGLGWRREEIARLRAEDFDGRTVTGVVKGNKSLTVGVPSWLLTEISTWRVTAGIDSGPLLPRAPEESRAISGSQLYRIVKRAARAAGLLPEKVTPHGLRRTKITIEGERDVPIKVRQLAVGHASLATTERYDRARDAARGAPGEVLADLVLRRATDDEIEAVFRCAFVFGDMRYRSDPTDIEDIWKAIKLGTVRAEHFEIPKADPALRELSLFSGKSAHQHICADVALWFARRGQSWTANQADCHAAGGTADIVTTDGSNIFAEVGNTKAEKVITCLRARQNILLVPYGFAPEVGLLLTVVGEVPENVEQLERMRQAAEKIR